MSSLHYLKDQDLIILLGDYVLKAYIQKKQKELDDTRAFHENIFQDGIDMNSEHHYLISDVIRYINETLYFSWTPLYVSERIKLYDDSVEPYKENTKLQRCGYQY